MRLATWRRRRDDDEPRSGNAADASTDELALPAVEAPDADGEAQVQADADVDLDAPPAPRRRPLYHRLLRLRHIAPTAWQRAAFADAPFALAVVLVLADVASAWTLVALPVAVAAVVKTHDLLAGALAGPAPPRKGPRG